MQKKELLIGAHVSIMGGFDQAILRGEKIGATCIQIFTKNNRQWKFKNISNEEALKFIAQQKNSTIKIVVAHASYLINLGSTSSLVVEKSINALVHELQRCDILQIPFLVLHPGTMHDKDEKKSLEFIAKNINTALQKAKPKHIMLLLETTAGQGSSIGNKFEQLAVIISHVAQKKHIGVCVDTCHIFAAGYNFDTSAAYKKLWRNFDKIIGLSKLKVLHINDSKKDLDSHVDRHENIGKGMIKPEAFKLLMHDKKFKNIPKILETPKKGDDLTNDMKNLETLRRYATK